MMYKYKTASLGACIMRHMGDFAHLPSDKNCHFFQNIAGEKRQKNAKKVAKVTLSVFGYLERSIYRFTEILYIIMDIITCAIYMRISEYKLKTASRYPLCNLCNLMQPMVAENSGIFARLGT